MSTDLSTELLDVAVRAARAAADLVRERADAGVTVAATKSSDVDVVTQADRDSETLLRATILAERPGDAFFGEEGEDVEGTTGVRWIVDPIDGTVNFVYGLPEYAISVAAEVDGRVVAGVVLNVATGVEYTAHRTPDGVVARKGDRPVVVRGPAPLAQRLVITGFSYDADVRRRQAEGLVRLLPQVRDIRRHGSCALELCHLADGQADAYFEVGVNLWDYAAGALVAEGAGARVEVHPGFPDRALVVAAPEHGFEEFLNAVLDAGYGGE
ncbi:inositol monophosphatase family protein [Nocardioides sp. CER19]|uniref:inositol monophosphatase family protein n=1 Tax=Nocardioides sp. CER19 TaxID=3038538 RepID=UPI00244BF4D9|nr:inositol monophosphatase family protein [Nocardioides sp. CER19]MDH2416574.1 inositol monophosphatase family protein [Nocardioides sp. CER19]